MNIPSHNPKTLEMQLRKILTGVEANPEDWPAGNKITNEILVKASDELNEKLNEIKKYEMNLSAERKKLQQFINDIAKPLYKKARDQAYSLYGKNSEKLKEYSLKKISSNVWQTVKQLKSIAASVDKLK
jgi:hypothetical protein